MRGVRPQVVGCTSPEGGAVRQGQGRRIVTQLDVAGDPDSQKMFHLGDVAGDPDSRKTFHLGNVSCGGYIGKPAHITHYFELLPVPVTPPPARPPSLPLFLQSIGNGPSVRYYAPGAGKVTAPINVEEWEASEPIDVDAFAENTETDNPSSSEVQAEVPGCPAQAAQADTVQTQAQKDARNAQLLFECCICGDTFVDPVVDGAEQAPRTLCMHLYCDRCIHRNLAQTFACPQCRSTITSAPMRDVLFERELANAIEDGVVSAATTRARQAALAIGEYFLREFGENLRYYLHVGLCKGTGERQLEGA
ncbi:hypothetical protein C8R44DRAFT_736610 [Mycena epipterygia]|nr:hypothetical protein C8R44DRAFT_736610 [Mycena epipterygia]